MKKIVPFHLLPLNVLNAYSEWSVYYREKHNELPKEVYIETSDNYAYYLKGNSALLAIFTMNEDGCYYY